MEPKVQEIKEESPDHEPVLSTHKPSKPADTQRLAKPTKGSPRPTPDSPDGSQPACSGPAANGFSSGDSSNKGSPPAQNSSPPSSINGNGDSPSTVFPAAPPLSVPGLVHEARHFAKMRLFFTTIVQFGTDVSSSTGDRVRSLVLALVSNAMSVEDFHRALQTTCDFPLRPFVLPFLRSNIPAMQREVAALARHAKQSPQQYLRQHEQLVLDPSFSPSEPSEIFHYMSELHLEAHSSSKRPRDNSYENGDMEYPSKRAHFSSESQAFSHHSGHYSEPSSSSLLHPPHAPAPHYLTYHPPAPPPRHSEDSRRNGDDEWKNIHVMLNCILSMVEKTKRALAILQHRPPTPAACSETPETEYVPPTWLRRAPADGAEQDVKKTAGDLMAHTIRVMEDRVADVRRRAEEAVNEVKRQAVLELQRAVSAAESKAAELVAAERARMEKLLLESRKHSATANSTSEAASSTQQSDSVESCWNCGRKANETCSGCNTARYCGSFCQHKDWEHHHQSCNSGETKDKVPPATSACSETK